MYTYLITISCSKFEESKKGKKTKRKGKKNSQPERKVSVLDFALPCHTEELKYYRKVQEI